MLRHSTGSPAKTTTLFHERRRPIFVARGGPRNGSDHPLNPPYTPDIQAAFDAIMPAGVDPLVLFRTLAVNTRVYERFRAGGLLDRGLLTLRQREIVIDRTCASTAADTNGASISPSLAAK
jgi:hypothetical protein